MKLQDRVDKAVKYIDNWSEFLLKNRNKENHDIDICIKEWIDNIQNIREILLDINVGK